jgi:tetratricopeptide (TPR) repeat protein
VISRTSTLHYKSAPENLREIARQLGVAHILEGSVQKSGDAVRVNVQLIKAVNDSNLWADTFDRKLTDIFSVAAFSAARTILEQRLAVKPEHARTIAVLAQVDAGLGRKELAIQEAQHAVDLMPVSKDVYDGALVLEGLAQVYTWTNEPDHAIELLQKLVTMPDYVNYARLKLHPIWNPLRGDPRFEKIVNSLAPKDQTK